MAKVRDEAINEVKIEEIARNAESNSRIDELESVHELPNATESCIRP